MAFVFSIKIGKTLSRLLLFFVLYYLKFLRKYIYQNFFYSLWSAQKFRILRNSETESSSYIWVEHLWRPQFRVKFYSENRDRWVAPPRRDWKDSAGDQTAEKSKVPSSAKYLLYIDIFIFIKGKQTRK